MGKKEIEQELKEDLNQETTGLKKELNLKQKEKFREWLKKAIDKEDRDRFEEAIKIIGKEWHVFRIKGDYFEKFVNILWKNKEDIREGKYCLWSSNFFWIDKNGKEKHPYSYESKICFLINPEHYKLIYDDNNKTQLKKVKELKENIKDGITEKNWQEIVNAYYDIELYDKRFKGKNILSCHDCFEIDCDLWAKEN
jgi:hypothetical protein